MPSRNVYFENLIYSSSVSSKFILQSNTSDRLYESMLLQLPVLLLLTCAATARATSPTTIFPANSDRIRVVGRTATTSAGSSTLYFDWSSVTIHASVTGPATILLAEANTTHRATSGNSYQVDISDDNAVSGSTVLRSFRLNTTAEVQEYQLLLQAGGPYALRVEKVTEARPVRTCCTGCRGCAESARCVMSNNAFVKPFVPLPWLLTCRMQVDWSGSLASVLRHSTHHRPLPPAASSASAIVSCVVHTRKGEHRCSRATARMNSMAPAKVHI